MVDYSKDGIAVTPNVTIAAIATPTGRGGIGVIRVSGPKVEVVARAILRVLPEPRYAYYGSFYARDGSVLDQGIALYFKAPHSFTGEDVLELQAHGGAVVLDLLLNEIIQFDVVLAKPGEFSERAVMHGKLDLVQAEAIADLIDASSSQAARAAMRSLQGEFSAKIHELVEHLTQLRLYVEAAIDFPEEEINFLQDEYISHSLTQWLEQLSALRMSAQQGVLLQEGMYVVLAGLPNAGKSSVLNGLSGQELAIVTDIPGTTRDIVRSDIQLAGIPLRIMDTAGLRESTDPIEQEGIRRARQAMQTADCLLWIVDVTSPSQEHQLLLPEGVTSPRHQITIYNKIDLLEVQPKIERYDDSHCDIYLSAKTGQGMELLRDQLKCYAGYQWVGEQIFTARRRHLVALEHAEQHVHRGKAQLIDYMAGELLAEELRLAQDALGEITGKILSDELLGRIFSSFCIGK